MVLIPKYITHLIVTHRITTVDMWLIRRHIMVTHINNPPILSRIKFPSYASDYAPQVYSNIEINVQPPSQYDPSTSSVPTNSSFTPESSDFNINNYARQFYSSELSFSRGNTLNK